MAHNIEDDLDDVIIGRPYPFKIGKKSFFLYPLTFAKMLLLKRHVKELGIDKDLLRVNPYLEAIRLAKAKRETCCHILAFHATPNTQKDLFDYDAITKRKNYFAQKMDGEDLASLMIQVLMADRTDTYIKHYGLDKERERLHKVLEIKQKVGKKNNLTFNGITIFGTFIQQCKELGYSDAEILYEKSYTFLRLMLADKIVSVYLSDEELEGLPTSLGGTLLDANDPKNTEKIEKMLAERGILKS